MAVAEQEVFHRHGIPITASGGTSRFVVDLAPESPLERPVPTQRWTLADPHKLDKGATMMKLRTRNATYARWVGQSPLLLSLPSSFACGR